ncbi:MAG: hypothetical protein ACP5D7_23195 [Limnospira sp.]
MYHAILQSSRSRSADGESTRGQNLGKFHQMTPFIELLLVVLPGLASMAIAVQTTTSCLSASLAIISVFVGMILAAIAVLGTALSFTYYFNSSFSQSQAYGFMFIPIIVPSFLYIGSVSGAFLVMFFYRQGSGDLTLVPWLMSRFLAVIITVCLTASLLASIRSGSDQTDNTLSHKTSDRASTSQPQTTASQSFFRGSTSLVWIELFIIAQGFASAGLGSHLSHWLFQTLIKN